MVGIEELDALDLTIWLGRGNDAAARLGCNQSTVSRRSNHCLQVFDLHLHKDAEGWPRIRQHDLLQLEREVHQRHRLRQGTHLRLDASLLAAPLLHGNVPRGWIAGSLDGLGWQRPLRLLEERILDAWITAMGQELEPGIGSMVLCVPLLLTPMQLACAPGHPLLGQGSLQLQDVAGLPRLAPRPGSYPRTERLLGPWREQHRPLTLEPHPRRRAAVADGLSLDQVLHYGTRFSLAHQGLLTPLPLDLGVQTELTLVMRRDVSDQAAMVQLVETLQQRALQAALTDLGVQGRN
jgi:hypothetical protein